MKEIVVLSGSGVTTKTAISASLALLVEGKVLVDCDVEAACLTRLLKPVVGESQDLTNCHIAVLDEEVCNQCGLCERVCRSGAIEDVIDNCEISASACQGCGLCFNVCPEEAITMQEKKGGTLFTGKTDCGPLVYAELAIMQENTGQLISMARQKARQIAKKEDLKWIVSDGPPGIGSPVFSALFEANLAVLVVAPTLAGISDLETLQTACSRFKVPAIVCLDQFDLNPVNTRQIESHCSKNGLEIGVNIPGQNSFTSSILHGIPVNEAGETLIPGELNTLWQVIKNKLNK